MNHAVRFDMDLATPPELQSALRRWQVRAGAVGAVALVAAVLIAFFQPEAFFRAWLWSYTLYLGVTLGSMALLMLQYLTGGAWGVVIRRPAEAAARTLPALAVLFIPVVIGIPWLYHWSHADAVAADALLQHKSLFLNIPAWVSRAVVYFAGWIGLAWMLGRWARHMEETGRLEAGRRLRIISAPGLIFYAFSVTFMSIDWVMSVDAHWFSTMFGLLFISGQLLSAMAFLIAVVVLLYRWRPFAEVLGERHIHDLGKLLLMAVMLWAYLAFSQFLIIWAGNLPEEVPWYLARLQGGWQYVGLALVVLHFALPFALLLSRDLKRSYRLLAGVALLVLAMRLVDLFWLVVPSFTRGSFAFTVMDLLVPMGLGGLWLALVARQAGARALLPIGDPHLEEALEHGKE